MPTLAATERNSAGSGPVVSAPRFTGRGREMAALASALASPPAVVLVEGEAGVGKSRLVREYLADAGQRTADHQPARVDVQRWRHHLAARHRHRRP